MARPPPATIPSLFTAAVPLHLRGLFSLPAATIFRGTSKNDYKPPSYFEEVAFSGLETAFPATSFVFAPFS